VEALTVKALLSDSALRPFEHSGYRFCPDASCDVVYFDAEARTFTTIDLRVRAWRKEAPGAHDLLLLRRERNGHQSRIVRTGRSKAEARVRAHIHAGRCACEVRNPKGACCLGDVTQAVKRVTHG
jgi:hypothetical protein